MFKREGRSGSGLGGRAFRFDAFPFFLGVMRSAYREGEPRGNLFVTDHGNLSYILNQGLAKADKQT